MRTVASLALALVVQTSLGAEYARVPQASRVFDFTDDAGVTHLTNMPEGRGAHMLVDDGVPESGSGRIPDRLPDAPFLRQWVEEAAARTGLEPALVYAVMAVESGYNAHALSAKGAAGLMQLMPETAAQYGVADPFDAHSNILGGTHYLRDLLDQFPGRIDLALAAYNAGSKAVVRAHGQVPAFAETQAYVPRVLSFYRQHGGEHWLNAE